MSKLYIAVNHNIFMQFTTNQLFDSRNSLLYIFKWELQAFHQYSGLKYLGVQKHIQNLSKNE
uniref:Uncharacterized protein n=1 Tax=Anguilla anguilla TaxID=7936 RepID=A0A0E9RAX4_ANGAN